MEFSFVLNLRSFLSLHLVRATLIIYRTAVLFRTFFRVPLSQYKTCTMYHCHNTKHVHVPLSQYKTCTCTTVTIQNMYMYHSHSTEHLRVLLSQYITCTCTTRHCKYYCLLSGIWSSGVFRCGNLRFRSCCSSISPRFDDKDVLYFYWNNEIRVVDLSWFTLYKCLSLHLNTFKRILVVQLTF